MNGIINKEYVFKIMNEAMVYVLTLGQMSMTMSQFKMFRKLVLDHFADARRELETGRCGEGKGMTSEGVNMSG